eukprot:CAMPEP_0118924004 /NCGR_PEP_ID=MMETSP1169-20130426/2331_1 /TAXON_ID=36882 /ORGANISM="Pyramimonas obovata, Strain CCMP722" /LENGTH=274 /DNA_ID=CAMNT_0006865079 /DNA_START=19 /DNA_END=840 /DNA_ORIENTATION=-
MGVGASASASKRAASGVAKMAVSKPAEEQGSSRQASRDVYLGEPVDLRATVFGAGRMGCAMAGQLALKGVAVTIYDHTEFTRSRAIQVTKGMMKELVDSGHLLESAKASAVERIRIAENMEDALREADIVFEAIPEDLNLKIEVFKSLDAAATLSSTVLTTNSISYFVEQIADSSTMQHKLCGVRFLHPVLLIDEVEVCSPKDRETEDRVLEMLKKTGLQPYRYEGTRRVLYQSEVAKAYNAMKAACQQAREAQGAGAERTMERTLSEENEVTD